MIEFWKFQGNGNDFVIFDDRKNLIDLTPEKVRKLCDRHFGIGADGVIVLRDIANADFEMLYYNADGHLASMCGNGGRCVAAFALMKKIAGERMTFKAYDGTHDALINKVSVEDKLHDVSLSMGDVTGIEKDEKFYFLDTGSPHYVEFVDKVAEIDVVAEGRKTRNSYRFSPDGTNVNFVEMSGDRLFVRTYERGVEDETLSCGTGVTASAIAAFLETGKKDFQIHTTGGEFGVEFEELKGMFKSVWLKGPAEMVFSGTIDLS